MTEDECKALAKQVAMATQYLVEEDAKIFAKLSIKAFNNERDCYSDDFIDENIFYEALGILDCRFRTCEM